MLNGVLLLIAIPLLLRVCMVREEEQDWSHSVDLPLLFVSGIFYAWGCLELASHHAGSDPIIEGKVLISSISTDFMEYCGGLGSMMLDDVDGWPAKRSRGAAWLPSVLAGPLGILDGLAMAAVVSCGLIGAGLYLWGRALGGRTAGVVAVLVSLAMGPMVLLSHMLSYYPEIIASFVLSAAATAWAIRARSPITMLLAGLGIGAVLLVDVRGLMWALPLLGGAGLAAVLGVKTEDDADPRVMWMRRGLLLAALLLPIVVSYQLGPWAYPAHTTSLELQLDLRPLFATHGATGPEFVPPYEIDSAYRWGLSPVWEIPATLSFILEQSSMEAPEGLASQEGVGSAAQHIDPWMLLAGLGLVGALAVAKLRSWRLWALFCTLFPFVIALRGMDIVEEMQPRILTHWMPGLAVLIGLGFSAILRLPGPEGLIGRHWTAPRWRLQLGALGLGCCALLELVSGSVSTWWSPSADWRTRWDQDELLVPYGLGTDATFRTDLQGEKVTGPEGGATAEIGGGYALSVRQACWAGLERDWNRGLRWEILSYDQPLEQFTTVLGEGWEEAFGDGIPEPSELPDGVFVHIEKRGTTLIVGFVGISGTPKDSLLVAEVEADRRYEDQCRGAYLARTWTHQAIGWEGLLMGVLLEEAGEYGLTADRDTVTDVEFEIWEAMEDWSGVETRPLDSIHMHHASITDSDGTDDCEHQNLDGEASWTADYDLSDADSWKSSPTAQVFQRGETPLIDELEALGKIQRR